MKSISFRRLFTVVISTTLLGASTILSVAQGIRDASSLKQSRADSQSAYVDLLSAALREPLVQGSFVEVKQRIAAAMEIPHLACIQLESNGTYLSECSQEQINPKSSDLFQRRLSFFANDTNAFGDLSVRFDNSDIHLITLQKVARDFAFNLVLTLLIFWVVSRSSRFAELELAAVLSAFDKKSAGNDNSRNLRIKEFVFLRHEIHELIMQAKDRAKFEALADMASQVSHDIRSPLAAINIAIGSIDAISAEKRALIQTAAKRINDIANDLLQQQRGISNEKQGISKDRQTIENTDIVELVSTAFSEAKTIFIDRPGLNVELKLPAITDGIRCNLDSKELCRVISNLINNAAEAIEETGSVIISLSSTKNDVSIHVADSGKGIPREIMEKLGNERISFGKGKHRNSGSGLGFYHATKTIQKLGGKLHLESELGKGTLVTMRFPRLHVSKDIQNTCAM